MTPEPPKLTQLRTRLLAMEKDNFKGEIEQKKEQELNMFTY